MAISYKLLSSILLLIFFSGCISFLSLFDTFESSNSNQTDFNEQWKRKQDKDRIKQSYNVQKNKDSQKEKECNEITKKYIKNENNYTIMNCSYD